MPAISRAAWWLSLAWIALVWNHAMVHGSEDLQPKSKNILNDRMKRLKMVEKLLPDTHDITVVKESDVPEDTLINPTNYVAHLRHPAVMRLLSPDNKQGIDSVEPSSAGKESIPFSKVVTIFFTLLILLDAAELGQDSWNSFGGLKATAEENIEALKT